MDIAQLPYPLLLKHSLFQTPRQLFVLNSFLQPFYSFFPQILHCENRGNWDFPGSPVVKTSPSCAEGRGSISGLGSKIPCASQPEHQNIKQKQLERLLKMILKKKSLTKMHHNWSFKKKKAIRISTALSPCEHSLCLCGWVVPTPNQGQPHHLSTGAHLLLSIQENCSNRSPLCLLHYFYLSHCWVIPGIIGTNCYYSCL